MAEKDKINKYDLVSKDAIDTWEQLISLVKKTEDQLNSLIDVGPRVDKSLKQSKNLDTLSRNIEIIADSIKKLVDAQKSLDKVSKSIIQLNKSRVESEKSVQRELEKTEKAAKKKALEEERAAKKAAAATEKANLASQRALKKFNDELDSFASRSNKSAKSGNGLISFFSSIKSAVIGVTAAYLSFNKAMEIFDSIVENTKRLDSLSFSMQKIIKDENELTQTQNFLNKVTSQYGLNIFDTSEAYIKFRAAVGASNLSVQDGQKIFESMSKASSVLGLTQEKTRLVFLALEQMISKGVISSEELRRQMGEQIPVAVNAMAKAFGIVNKSSDGSVASLMKFMKQGKVISEDVLPEFANQVEKLLGVETVNKVDTLTAAQTRLSNSWVDWVKNLNSAPALIKIYNSLADALDRITRGMKPDSTIISERSANLVSDVVEKMKGLTDQEERRKVLMQGIIDLSEKQSKISSKIASDEKNRPGVLQKASETISRGLGAGFGSAFTTGLDFEEIFQDTLLDEKAYKKAIADITKNMEELSNVTTKTSKKTEVETEAEFKKRFNIIKNSYDREFNEFKESQEQMKLQAFKNLRDTGADELQLEQASRGLQMDLDKNLFEFKDNQYKKLVELASGHEETLTQITEQQTDARADYNKKYTDFLINEDNKAYDEHVRALEKIKQEEKRAAEEKKDKAFAAIEGEMQGASIGIDASFLNEIKGAKYDYQRQDITDKYNKLKLESNKEYLTKMLSIENLTTNEIADIQRNLFNTEKALEEAKRAEAEKTAKRKQELEKASFDLGVKAISDTFSMFSTFQDARMQKIEYQYEREKNLAGNNLDAKIAAENKYDKEKRKIQKRQAILSKVQGLFDVAVDTARGVMEATATGLLPLIPFIIALGAANAAVIMASPIPGYELGGEHDGGIARFSEHGKQELFIPADGSSPIITPPTETIANMPAGTFIPNSDLTNMLINEMAESDRSDINLKETNSILNKMLNKSEYIYEKGFKITNKNNIFGRYVSRN